MTPDSTVEAAREALDWIEWRGNWQDCRLCGRKRTDGHDKNCAIPRIIAAARAEGAEAIERDDEWARAYERMGREIGELEADLLACAKALRELRERHRQRWSTVFGMDVCDSHEPSAEWPCEEAEILDAALDRPNVARLLEPK